MDDYEGVNDTPLSLHKYLYVGADPVNILDPSGRSFVIKELIGTFAGLAIRNASRLRAALMLGRILAILAGEYAFLEAIDALKGGDRVYFAHGTSLTNALSISTFGINEIAVDTIQREHRDFPYRPIDTHGHWFAAPLSPNYFIGLYVARYFAEKRYPNEKRATVIGSIPKRTADYFYLTGDLKIAPTLKIGVGGLIPYLGKLFAYPELAFSPNTFSTINRENQGKWGVIPLPDEKTDWL